MNGRAFSEFLKSNDTLRVFVSNTLVFSSRKSGLLALVEYIDNFAARYNGALVLDKVMGNAAALLSIKAGCREVCSPLGSELAVSVLDRYGIRYHINRIVPYIRRDNRKDMCPMERRSIDKEPEEFYAIMKATVGPG